MTALLTRNSAANLVSPMRRATTSIQTTILVWLTIAVIVLLGAPTKLRLEQTAGKQPASQLCDDCTRTFAADDLALTHDGVQHLLAKVRFWADTPLSSFAAIAVLPAHPDQSGRPHVFHPHAPRLSLAGIVELRI